MATAGIVLCGGKSSRMGASKAWLDVGGETLLARTVRVVGGVTAPVVVVAAVGQDLPPLPESVSVVRDAVADRGPLGGIAAGLEAIARHATAAFVAATDTPFLHPEFVRRLVELFGVDHGGGFDLVAPRVAGRVHPLTAVYAVSACGAIGARLASENLRLTELLAQLRTSYVDETLLLAGAELAAADPELRSLCNVNTPEEYAAALAELGATSAVGSHT